MNVELFDKAVDFIASVPDQQVDLNDWQRSTVANKGRFTYSSEDVTCGTLACAGGWLALNQEFKNLGVGQGISGAPEFGGTSGYGAMAKLFDIPKDDATGLFYFRTLEDRDLFGEVAYAEMTDRQMWLSRARLVRAKYATAP